MGIIVALVSIVAQMLIALVRLAVFGVIALVRAFK